MSTIGEWNESLDNIDDLISCMGSLEREDIIYLDEYLVGETSPHTQSPSHWLALMKGEVQEENGDDEDSHHMIPEGAELGTFDNPGDEKLIIDLSMEKKSGIGIQSIKQPRSTQGIVKPKFVSYESFPANKTKQFQCELCGMKLSTREARRRHILAKHIKERKHFCKICGKSFIFQFALKAHKAVHAEIPHYICVCGMSYTVRASYMDHIKRIHRAASEIKYPCELCFKSFGDRQTLRIHLISVHKPKTIACTHKGCTKVFSTIGLMRNHYRYHLNRKFTCDECGRSFSTESYMYKHRLSHSGIREHVCLDCGKTYLSASHLTKHRHMAHSTARPFQCSFCGKCYKTKDQVIYHESSHKGEKPFQCEVCGYATSYRNTYYAHRKKHFVKKTPDDGVSSETQKMSPDVLKNNASDAKSGDDNNCNKPKKSVGTSKGRGKSRDSNRGKTSNTQKKGELRNKASMRAELEKTNDDCTSGHHIPLLEKGDICERKQSLQPTSSKEPVDVIYVVSRSNPNEKLEQPTTMFLSANNQSNASVTTCEESLKISSEGPYLLGHTESTVVQEKMGCYADVSQSVETQAHFSVTNKNREEKNNLILSSEKENSCIILSSSGRCAVPSCDSGDDSLLLIKVGENSYIGVCRHHTFTDQENISQTNGELSKQTDAMDVGLSGFDNISIHFLAEAPREEDALITLAAPDTILKSSEEMVGTDELGDKDNPTISLITLPEKYDKVELDMEEPISQVPELTCELLDGDGTCVSQPDNDDVKLNVNGVCPVEEFSTMIELDSGVASLSGHIVDDSLSLAQLEVICPLCDEQFLCMDAYVTHLECSHN